MERKLLQDQVAIVTGGSSGIGTGIAKSLAAAGAKVVINHSSPKSREEAEKIQGEISSDGGEAIIFRADVSREEDVRAMFAETKKAFGTVDILINNAGLQKDARLVDMSLDDWNTVIGINLTGQFLCAREAIREFLSRGPQPEKSKALGKIICISSVHEVIPWAGHANYAASKGGIKLLMETIAQEYAPDKIRVNSIGPGAIKTPINESEWKDPEKKENLLKMIPYGRIGNTDDIGKAAVWLASDESDYVTGTTLFVDGGMTLYPEFAHGG
ncbi:MAG: SDR family oxidoreductase [Mucilaginibacter polytrichastri]|nr:SDR family oxidoreductase [Mucilaginibacter polytrichastri]